MSDMPDFRYPDDPFGLDKPAPVPSGSEGLSIPADPWALAYTEGSLFTTGSIGVEHPWVFGSEAAAIDGVAAAEREAPGFGSLHPVEVAWEHLLDRYETVLLIEGDSRWPIGLADLSGGDEPPLPDEPYALFVSGGGIDRFSDAHHEGEWVVHRDTRGDFVLFFEDLDSAETVLKEFRDATGDHAEVRRTRAISLTDTQGVRFTHRDGRREDLSRDEYLRRCR